MENYLIFNVKYCTFLRVSNSRDGYIDSHEMVESIDDATVFIYSKKTDIDLLENDFVKDVLRYLNIYSNFQDFIFCHCDSTFTKKGIRIIDVDYENPILNCKGLDVKDLYNK